MISLAKNKIKKFHHGWFVVRNRTPSEADEGIGPLERNIREQDFFGSQPWNQLPDHRRGTHALKKYLADLLCTRIKQAFPTFLRDIHTKLESAMVALESMSTARKTIAEKRSYLTKIAQEFERRASQSIRGRYDSIAENDTKLRMKVREANDAFALDMRSNGQSVPFVGEIANARTIASKSTETLSYQPSKSGAFSFASSDSVKVRFPCPKTTYVPFQALQTKEDPGWTSHWQSISFLAPFTNYSFEELRLNDTVQDKSTSLTPEKGAKESAQAKQTSTQKPSSPWGQPNQAAAIPNGGGNASSLLSTSTTTSTFGTTPDHTKQASNGSFGGFGGGNTSSKGLFGIPSQSSSVGAFSSQNQQSTNGGLFNTVQKPLPPLINVFGSKTTNQSSEIYGWIRDEIKACRGTELQGTLNPDVLPLLFHKQARNWEPISETHFANICQTTIDALTQVLHSICTDPLTRERLGALICNASKESGRQRLSQLSTRMEKILSKHLQTSNPAFEQKVSEARRKRFQAALERYKSTQEARKRLLSSIDNTGSGDNANDDQLLVIDMRDTASLFAELHISNSQNLQDEVHDTLKAYYEIAREDFIEYVNQHIVETYLDDPHGPVLLFDPSHVAGLNDGEIEFLAAEDETLVKDRASQQEALTRLSRAKEIAVRYSA